MLPRSRREIGGPWVRLIAAVAALVLVAGGVIWWVAGRDPDYCGLVEQHSAAVQAGVEPLHDVVAGLPELEALAAKAPSDLKDEWQVVVNSVRGFAQAFEETGVDPGTADLSALPDRVTPEQRQRIKDAASGLLSPQVTEAVAGIEQHALDVCHTPLEL